MADRVVLQPVDHPRCHRAGPRALAIAYLPAMNTIFGTAPIGAEVSLRILAIAVAASLVVAVDKRLRRLA